MAKVLGVCRLTTQIACSNVHVLFAAVNTLSLRQIPRVIKAVNDCSPKYSTADFDGHRRANLDPWNQHLLINDFASRVESSSAILAIKKQLHIYRRRDKLLLQPLNEPYHFFSFFSSFFSFATQTNPWVFREAGSRDGRYTTDPAAH